MADAIESLYEKKVDTLLSKMFGDSQSELKAITKMSLMNNILTDDMKRTLLDLREKAMKEAEMINEEMSMTLDASGNVIPLLAESPGYEKPLLEKVEQNDM